MSFDLDFGFATTCIVRGIYFTAALQLPQSKIQNRQSKISKCWAQLMICSIALPPWAMGIGRPMRSGTVSVRVDAEQVVDRRHEVAGRDRVARPDSAACLSVAP